MKETRVEHITILLVLIQAGGPEAPVLHPLATWIGSCVVEGKWEVRLQVVVTSFLLGLSCILCDCKDYFSLLQFPCKIKQSPLWAQ